jgi:hypothetical protein
MPGPASCQTGDPKGQKLEAKIIRPQENPSFLKRSRPREAGQRRVVAEPWRGAAAHSVSRLPADRPYRIRSVRGNPRAALRFSTRDLATASTRWFRNRRAANFKLTSALNRDTAFSATAPALLYLLRPCSPRPAFGASPHSPCAMGTSLRLRCAVVRHRARGSAAVGPSPGSAGGCAAAGGWTSHPGENRLVTDRALIAAVARNQADGLTCPGEDCRKMRAVVPAALVEVDGEEFELRLGGAGLEGAPATTLWGVPGR